MLLAFVLVNAVVFVVHLKRNFFNYDFDHVALDGISHSGIWIVWPTVEGLMFAAFVLVYLQSRWTPPFGAALAWLGKISYSLYVWHTLVFLLAVKAHINFLPPFELGALIVFPIATAVSAVSYRLIEAPFLEMRVRYIRPRAAGAGEIKVPTPAEAG